MTEFKLEAKTRDENGRQTRASGFIPAVVYGNNSKSTPVAVDGRTFNRLYKEAGTSNLIDLKVDSDKSFKTLVNDIQLDPVTLGIIHIDFFKVNMKEKIHAEIPLNFVGESHAVVNLEGVLITSKDAVEVECLPGDLPSELDIDLSVLDDFEKDIRISNIKAPEGVEILDDPEEVIVHVEPPRSEEELAELETEVVEDVSAVEVEGEKKDEEDAEGEGKTE